MSHSVQAGTIPMPNGPPIRILPSGWIALAETLGWSPWITGEKAGIQSPRGTQPGQHDCAPPN